MSLLAVEPGASFERVLGALESKGYLVRRTPGRSWEAKAQCPVHEDREPSLSVRWVNDKTLLHCFAGCTGEPGHGDPAPVLSALELAGNELYDAPPSRQPRGPRRRPQPGPPPAGASAGPAPAASKTPDLGRPTSRWRTIVEYNYNDEHGQPRGKVRREERTLERGRQKRFWQYHFAGHCPRSECVVGRAKTPHTSGWAPGAPGEPVLYNLPQLAAAIAAGHEIWLPEGEKDADALNGHFAAHQVDALATTNTGGSQSWHPSYTDALRGARLVIVEDNDSPKPHPVTGQMLPPAGGRRTALLTAELRSAAASLRVVRARTGKDSFDHLAAGHGLADFLPVAESAPAPQPHPERRHNLELLKGGGGGPPRGTSGGGGEPRELPNDRVRYLERHGELVKEVTDRNGEIIRYEVVLGCTARILRVDQRITDAGQAPSTTGVLIEATAPDGQEPVQMSVGRKAWEAGEWLQDLPWPDVFYDSSRNGLAKVRDAIRTTSPAARVAVVHGAPGWIRGPDGEWAFIHAGGAICANGARDADVELPPQLARYELPAPASGPDSLRAAAGHSTGLLDLLPPRIGAVLAGVSYRAAISRMPPAVTLLGPPGSYKTSMAKVALHHFAPDLAFDESVLSLSERGATGNAGAKLMHLSRDVLLLADDAAPDRSLKAASERVAAIVRLQYNGETRDRLDREAQLQRSEPPRGSLLVSAEVSPSAASARQRTLVVPLSAGQISRDARIALWQPASRHGRAALLASFIAWQAGRRDEILEQLARLAAGYADQWHEEGHDERTAESLAHLAAGWRLMLDFLASAGAYTPAEIAELWQRAWAGLAEAGRTQEDPDEPIDPARRILARLRTALIGGYGHLTDPAGHAPPVGEAARYGYSLESLPARRSFTGDSEPAVALRAGGDWVGCYDGPSGDRRIWLVPELALIMLRRLGDRMGEPCEETVSSLGEWLRQADIGLVTTEEKATGRLRRSTQHSMPGGRRMWVWDIPDVALFPDDEPGETPPPPSVAPTAALPPAGLVPRSAGPERPPRPGPPDPPPGISADPTEGTMNTSSAAATPPGGGWPAGSVGEQAWLQAGEPARPVPAAPAGAGRRAAARGSAADRWAAAAAVVDHDGIYLPGGEKLPLPRNLAHIGQLASLPTQLRLGWGGGARPPFPGQLWLTRMFLEFVGLPGHLPQDNIAQADQVLAEAASHPFITKALAAGWQISEMSRTRLGHRMRIWSAGDRAGAQLVFVPYITADNPLLADEPRPAPLARRLDLYARQVGVPFARSAAYSGHDLLEQLDIRRKVTLSRPATPPPVPVGGEGNISFQRAPTEQEAALRYVHSYDVTAAWLAAAKGAELGLGEAQHRSEPDFDPRLPGLWRVTPPAWAARPLPSPFASRTREPDGTAWLPTPTLALAADREIFGLDIRPAEAWVWPSHTRYLELWASELNAARTAMADLADGGDADARAVLSSLKDTYSGAITLFGSQQLDADPDTGRARHKFYRPDWAHMVIATARARLWRKILAVESAEPGRWPLAVDRDNLLYASDEQDPAAACPAGLRLGNQLGGVKTKGSALMSEAAGPLAASRLPFDSLTDPGRWAGEAETGNG